MRDRRHQFGIAELGPLLEVGFCGQLRFENRRRSTALRAHMAMAVGSVGGGGGLLFANGHAGELALGLRWLAF